MIASLPMYARDENRAALDRLWQRIRAALPARVAPPAKLDHAADPWSVWTSSDLFLSQTCGLPFRARLHGSVALVGAADFRLDGVPPGQYRSVILTRRDDRRKALSEYSEATWAVNEVLSQSGWAAPNAHLADIELPLIDRVLLTGSHRASARAVMDGTADIAALDAVTWRLIRTFDSVADTLRVLDETRPTPGLPFITAPGRDADAIRDALRTAVSETNDEDRRVLAGIADIVPASEPAYLALPDAPPLPEKTSIAT